RCGAVVILAEHSLSRAGARGDGRVEPMGLACVADREGDRAVRGIGRDLHAVLCGDRDKPVAVYRAVPFHAVGNSVDAEYPGIPAGRHDVPAADHPDQHGLVLLGLPRQGPGGYRVSLEARRTTKITKEGTKITKSSCSSWALCVLCVSCFFERLAVRDFLPRF